MNATRTAQHAPREIDCMDVTRAIFVLCKLPDRRNFFLKLNREIPFIECNREMAQHLFEDIRQRNELNWRFCASTPKQLAANVDDWCKANRMQLTEQALQWLGEWVTTRPESLETPTGNANQSPANESGQTNPGNVGVDTRAVRTRPNETPLTIEQKLSFITDPTAKQRAVATLQAMERDRVITPTPGGFRWRKGTTHAQIIAFFDRANMVWGLCKDDNDRRQWKPFCTLFVDGNGQPMRPRQCVDWTQDKAKRGYNTRGESKIIKYLD